MSLFFVPVSEIKLGSVTVVGINECLIEQSVSDFADRAVITMPRNFTKRDGKGITEFIHKGDPVVVRLGYDELEVEFEGYIDTIGDATPLVVTCDGVWWPHKRNALKPKTFEKATLKEVLEYAFVGYTIDCPAVELGTWMVGSVSSHVVVKALRDQVGFYTKLDQASKKITCYYPYEAATTVKHTYVFGTNDDDKIKQLQQRKMFPNIKRNNLVFSVKADIKIRLTAKAKQRDGSTLKVELGSDDPGASKRTRNYGSNITTAEALKAEAEKDLKRMVFDGYTGTVTGFGWPRVEAGDAVTFVDPDNAEREASYLVDKVQKKYSVTTGYERTITPSFKEQLKIKN